MHKLMIIAAIGTLAIGCKKKKAEDGAASAKGAEGAALAAEPAPADLTPSEKPPFDALKLVMNGKRHTNGWPRYDLYNLSTKPVTFVAIYGYAYDKDGKQVARTSVPLSWNGKTAPGTKDSYDLMIGGNDKVPATAVSYAVCYDSIKFEGDADMTTETGRCPEQMPKPAPSAAVPAAAAGKAAAGKADCAPGAYIDPSGVFCVVVPVGFKPPEKGPRTDENETITQFGNDDGFNFTITYRTGGNFDDFKGAMAPKATEDLTIITNEPLGGDGFYDKTKSAESTNTYQFSTVKRGDGFVYCETAYDSKTTQDPDDACKTLRAL